MVGFCFLSHRCKAAELLVLEGFNFEGLGEGWRASEPAPTCVPARRYLSIKQLWQELWQGVWGAVLLISTVIQVSEITLQARQAA